MANVSSLIILGNDAVTACVERIDAHAKGLHHADCHRDVRFRDDWPPQDQLNRRFCTGGGHQKRAQELTG